MLRITWDSEVDILMVYLGDVVKRRQSGKHLDVGGAYVDLAEDGTILAIEIKDASKKYPVENLRVRSPKGPSRLCPVGATWPSLPAFSAPWPALGSIALHCCANAFYY